ncbi:MAG: hypothetical protein ACLPKB_24440 [Xanthobacteraceae bacterium]
MSRGSLIFLIVVAVLALVGIVAFVGRWWPTDPVLALPIAVIGGVFVLLVTLALVAVAFALLGLADKSQALALPEGSIRAVIALSLVMLFTIVSIFLYNSLSNSGTIQTIHDLTDQQQKEFVSKIPSANIVLVQPVSQDGSTKFTIYYQNSSHAAEDFAKQLLVLLGTLVTAVASFFFGANSVAGVVGNASKVQAPSPIKLMGTDPGSLKRDGSVQDLRVLGENLSQVNDIRLVKDGETINITQVTSGGSEAAGKVKIDNTRQAGKWDVIVSDGQNQGKLQNYLELV